MNKIKGITKGIAGGLVAFGASEIVSKAAQNFVDQLLHAHPHLVVIGTVAALLATLFHQPTNQPAAQQLKSLATTLSK